MTDWFMEDPTSEAFSPTLLAQVLAATVKLPQPEEKVAHGSSDSAPSSPGGGAGMFPNPAYFPP